jgi:hypothetical protein
MQENYVSLYYVEEKGEQVPQYKKTPHTRAHTNATHHTQLRTRSHTSTQQTTILHLNHPKQSKSITTTPSTRIRHPKGVDVVGTDRKCQARLSPDGS